MTALPLIRKELAKTGYSAVVSDYVFSDVFMPTSPNRTVSLAAFTHTPPSYRNAAIAVVEINKDTGPHLTRGYRALGAPLLFVIDDQNVTVWEVSSEARPVIYEQVNLDQVSALFAQNRDTWNPQRIHNAKALGQLDQSYQLDFVDVGLLPAIEGEVHSKLDRLLSETLTEIVRLRVAESRNQIHDQLVFRTVFRLLAAKVLRDRGHEFADSWDATNIDTVLEGISKYYRLPALPDESGSLRGTPFEVAWKRLLDGINFRNITSHDLAFVYENTLVTDETRKHFGVHSTPRSVAEYVVNKLKLWSDDIDNTTVYEPFSGAGVFMVAALRRLQELLPVEMTEQEKHKFLVKRISGDEIEPFAVEVAKLSLILADYPNENGWNISNVDLFDNFAISRHAMGARIVLCNPPFEKFSQQDRLRYPEAAAKSSRKPAAALAAVLEVEPDALGFVLPEPFIDGPHYRTLREATEKRYKDIEIVSLPDRIFKASTIRSSLLIAQEPRGENNSTSLQSTSVRTQDRERFLNSGKVSDTRTKTRTIGDNLGQLWIDELDEVWQALTELPRLGSITEIHRGIEWQRNQSRAAQQEPKNGFRPGIHAADSIYTFSHRRPVYLDCRPSRLRGGAIHYPWDKPKVLANAARISRGPWCFAAAIDRKGLIGSQQLFGIWPVPEKQKISLETLCALLNNPIIVAYISSHSPPDRLRIKTLRSAPIPKFLPSELDDLVKEYVRILRNEPALSSPTFVERANRALHEIDAAILNAYDLPPKLEKRVLDYFLDEKRPTTHEWSHWFPVDFQAFLPLHRYLSEEFQTAASGWVLKVFTPLPREEATALREYLD